MYYVTPSQPSTSILSSIKLSLRPPSPSSSSATHDLVTSTGTRLLIYSLSPTGLILILDQPINGLITNLHALPCPAHSASFKDQECILAITSRLDVLVLAWQDDPRAGSGAGGYLRKIGLANWADAPEVIPEVGPFVAATIPGRGGESRCAVAHSSQGSIRVLPLPEAEAEQGAMAGGKRRGSTKSSRTAVAIGDEGKGIDLAQSFQARIPHYNLRSLCLLPPSPTSSSDADYPKVAYLHVDHTGRLFLRSCLLHLSDRDSIPLPLLTSAPTLPLTPTSSSGGRRRSSAASVASSGGGRARSSGLRKEMDVVGEGDKVDKTKVLGREIEIGDPGARWVMPVSIPVKRGGEEDEDEDEEGEEGGREDAVNGVLVVGEESVEWVPLAEWAGVARAGARGTASGDLKGKGKGKERERDVRSGEREEEVGGDLKRVVGSLPLGEITAWAPIPNHPRLFLLGDIYGSLYRLRVVLSRSPSPRVIELEIFNYGSISTPSTLSHLSDEYVHVGSRTGDHQIVRLPRLLLDSDMREEVAENGWSVEREIVQVQGNAGPVNDFCVVEEGAGGQSYIVTASGMYRDGSLRVIRHGVGLTSLASLEIEGIQGLWPIDSSSSSGTSNKSTHDLLMTSFISFTRFFSLSSAIGTISEVQIPGLSSDGPTLAVGKLKGNVVQVVEKGVKAANRGEGGDWREEKGWEVKEGRWITAADVREEGVLLALSGGEVILLDFNVEDRNFVEVARTNLHDGSGVSSLHVHTLPSTGKTIAALSVWNSDPPSIITLALPSLKTLSTVPLDDADAVITSVRLSTFEDGATQLFVGLADGRLVVWAVDGDGHGEGEGGVVEASRKSIVVGNRPVRLAGLRRGGRRKQVEGKMDVDGENESADEAEEEAVFVASDRSTIVTRKMGKLTYASANLLDVNAASSISTSSFPSSFICASPTELRIGRIDDIDQLHARRAPLGNEQPRKIAHYVAGDFRAFVVACHWEMMDRDTGEVEERASLKVLEEDTFALVWEYDFQEDEEVQCLQVAYLNSSGRARASAAPEIVVGTGFLRRNEHIPGDGRLMSFEFDPRTKEFELKREYMTDGAIMGIAPLPDGNLVVGRNSTVFVYRPTPGSFNFMSIWQSSIFIQSITTRGYDILVSDIMKSLTLLRWSANDSATSSQSTSTQEFSLKELSRDYHPYWLTSAAFLNPRKGKDYIAADLSGNLLTMRYEGVDEKIKTVLAQRAKWHAGENISQLRHGSLVPTLSNGESSVTDTHLLYATNTGVIGTVIEVEGPSAKLLSDLERNMRSLFSRSDGELPPAIERISGYLPHDKWRAFRSETEHSDAVGFVDGAFVERLLELDEKEIKLVLKGESKAERIKASVASVVGLLEDLQRGH